MYIYICFNSYSSIESITEIVTHPLFRYFVQNIQNIIHADVLILVIDLYYRLVCTKKKMCAIEF